MNTPWAGEMKIRIPEKSVVAEANASDKGGHENRTALDEEIRNYSITMLAAE